jgi:ammonia channel protein AmtB
LRLEASDSLVGGFETDRDDLATIPLQSRMVFQLKFAAIVPALITGAFTGRMKFVSGGDRNFRTGPCCRTALG